MERDYEEIFQKVLDYEQTLHEKNRKRIKIGLKCIWIVPLFFLALLFLTGSNKVIFLILWIVSLFALSIYLIVVEYMDHNLQEKIMELKGEEGTIEAVTPADDDDRHTSRTYVLLDTAPENTKLTHIDRL